MASTRRKLWLIGIVAGSVILMVGPYATAKDMKGKFGIGGNIGYALMDIKGVNEWLDICDERVATIITEWETTAKEHLEGDVAYLGGIKYGLTSSLMLTASGGAISSKGKYAATGPTEVEINDKVSATFFGGGVQYILRGGENLNIFLEGGADYYGVKYEEISTENHRIDLPEQQRIAEGSTIGFRVGGGLDYFFSNNIAIGLNLFYRMAKVPELETKRDDWGLSKEGEPIKVYTEPDFSDSKILEIDLSGVHIYLTVYFFFR